MTFEAWGGFGCCRRYDGAYPLSRIHDWLRGCEGPWSFYFQGVP
jgi:hypothetical protein